MLEFNEKFRFWQHPYEHHEQDYRAFLSNCPIGLGPCVRHVRNNIEDVTNIYFDRWASLLTCPVEDEDGNLWSLFPPSWDQQAQTWIRGHPNAPSTGWITYADARTFVWTCAILQEGSHTLKGYPPQDVEEPEPWQCGHWIKLLNVDGPDKTPLDTGRSTPFEREWVEPRTYQRWAHYGTLYGFNYHSGALLGPVDTGGAPIWRHFGDMYFDQILLLLYLRITSFTFSRQLTQISARARDQRHLGKAGREHWQAEFRALRWNFALFTNLYEFPLLSNQQQGLETYEIAREHMDVSELFREIQQEIRNTHEHLAMEVGQDHTDLSTQLTVVATVGLFFALVTGALGMNAIVQKFIDGKSGYSNDIVISLIFLFGFAIIMGYGYARSKKIAEGFDWIISQLKSKD